jgi:CSLREA domain-containing protein
LQVRYSLIGTNAGTNLVSAPVGSPDANGNIIGGGDLGMIDPVLGPLADNGGPTLTHALLPGSPAINAGDPTTVGGLNGVPSFDQRGESFTRVFAGRIDIGAYERQSFVVDTLVDENDKNYGPGDLSLREAIDRANSNQGPDIIEFSPALAGGTIMLKTGSLQIRNDVQVVGLGAELLTIDNSLTQGPIFNVDDLSNNAQIVVAFSGMTLTGSKQSAIRSVEALTVDSMTFRGNEGPRAGGIAVEQGSNQVLNAKLTVLNSQFIDNSATSTDSTTGGGIMFRGRFGEFTVENSIFVENSSGGYGGGVGVGGFSNLVNIADSTFTGNDAARGGAISITDDNAQPATFQRIEVTNNTAQVYGGGLFLSGKAVMIIESDISGNRTLTAPNGYVGGGGIFKSSGDPFTIERTRITGNESAMNGGGILLSGSPLIITDSIVSDNKAGRAGGGLSAGSVGVEMRRTTVAGNEAMTSGGGIHLSGGRGGRSLILADSTISENTAHEVGGGINSSGFGLQISNSTISTNSADVSGGGIYASGVPASLIAHSTIAFNVADADGDDIGGGGGIAAGTPSPMVLENTIVVGNLDANEGPSDVMGVLESKFSLISVGAEFLGPLADNGGPTKTHALLPGSPAIDAGDPAAMGIPEFDQRGGPFNRVFGAATDIGAFEAQSLLVDTLADELDGDHSAGDFSLREAIDLANRIAGANTIEFSPELAGGTILMVMGEYAITDAVEIAGLGAELLTIDAQQQSRIFNVTAKLGDFAFSGMTLTKGSTSQSGVSFGGGAINSNSSGLLTLDGVHFVGNRTLGLDARGGAVYATNALRVRDSQFIENSTAGNNGAGGAVHAIGNVTIEASGFARNKTAGINAGGGAVFTLSSLTANEASFASNTTLGSSSSGGAISASSLTMTNSTVAANSTNGSSSAGGGINLGVPRGRGVALAALGSTISDCIIIDNYTVGNNSRGGGISAGDPITVERSAISGNFTIGGGSRGGGLYAPMGILRDSQIVANRTYGVGSSGGGVAGSSLNGWQIVGSSFLLNETFGGGAGGAGVFMDGALTVTDSTFNGNSAFGPQAAGGAINAIRVGSNLLVQSSTFANNSASRGGAIATQLNTTIIDSVLTGNRTNGTGGDQAGGGAIYQANSPNGLTIMRSRIANNQALGINTVGGGGIRANGQTIIVQSEISNNRVIGQGGRGGGVFIQGPATITETTISENQVIGSSGSGGGVFLMAANLPHSILSSTISGNQVTGEQTRGGGLYSVGRIEMRHSTVTGNRVSSANGQAGGVGFVQSQSTISHSIIAGNFTGAVASDLRGQPLLSYSLVGTKTGTELNEAPLGSPDANGNIVGGPLHGLIDPLLSPLADNGGPTMTHAMLASSPAINAGDPALAAGVDGTPLFDQRGAPFGRVANGRIDIGALESQPAAGQYSGDFDGDGDVDGRDFLAWQRGYGQTLGATSSDGDAMTDGDVDGLDLVVWQEMYGTTNAESGLRNADSAELSALQTPSSLRGSLAVSPREIASGDEAAFEEHYVEPVDRALEQWVPLRRVSVDFGDIVTHRPVKRRALV